MIGIKLTQGRFAMIDDDDLAKISPLKWRWNKSRMKFGYAVASIPLGRKGHKKGVRRKRLNAMMHNVILPPPEGLEVDHIDGNGLNNQKYNLRHVTRAQQCMNRAPQIGKSSQFKGVRFWKLKQRWQARIRIHRKEVHLGYFNTERAAAVAYNSAARTAFGQFARLNNIQD